MKTLDPNIKTKWLEKLRSGDYEQAQHYLYSDGSGGREPGYCCVGVLCEVLIEEGKGRWNKNADGHFVFLTDIAPDDDQMTGSLNYSVLEAIGLDSRTSNEDNQGRLISMNDGGRYSFTDIADWIGANL